MTMARIKIITFIIISLLLSSCLTVKQIERNCDKFAKVCDVGTSEVITETQTIILRDTLIYWHPMTQVVERVDTVFIQNEVAWTDMSYLEVELAHSTAWVTGNALKHTLTQKGDSIQLQLKNALERIETLKNTTYSETIPIVTKYVPLLYKILAAVGCFSVLVIGLWVFMRIRN